RVVHRAGPAARPRGHPRWGPRWGRGRLMPLLYPLLVSTLLFAIGVYGVLARRNAILVRMGVELRLDAGHLHLVAFEAWDGGGLRSGQVLTGFVITIGAAGIGLGLAIVLRLFRLRGHVGVDRVRALAGREGAGPPEDVMVADEWADGADHARDLVD